MSNLLFAIPLSRLTDVRTGVGTDSILMVRLACDILLDSVALRAKGVRSKRLSIRALAGRLADDEPFRTLASPPLPMGVVPLSSSSSSSSTTTIGGHRIEPLMILGPGGPDRRAAHGAIRWLRITLNGPLAHAPLTPPPGATASNSGAHKRHHSRTRSMELFADLKLSNVGGAGGRSPSPHSPHSPSPPDSPDPTSLRSLGLRAPPSLAISIPRSESSFDFDPDWEDDCVLAVFGFRLDHEPPPVASHVIQLLNVGTRLAAHRQTLTIPSLQSTSPLPAGSQSSKKEEQPTPSALLRDVAEADLLAGLALSASRAFVQAAEFFRRARASLWQLAMAAPPTDDGQLYARQCMTRAVDCEVLAADVLNEHHHPLQKLRAMHSAERLAAADIQSLPTWGMSPSAIAALAATTSSASSSSSSLSPSPPPMVAPLSGPSNPGWWPSPSLDGRADMATNLRRLQPSLSQLLLSRLTAPSSSSTLRLAAARQLQLLVDQLGPSLAATIPSYIAGVSDAFIHVLAAATSIGLATDGSVDSPDVGIPVPPQLKSEVKQPLEMPPAAMTLTRPKRLVVEDDRKGGWPRPKSSDGKHDSPEKKATDTNSGGEKDSTVIHNPVDRARQAHRISQLLEQLLSLIRSVHALVAELAPRSLLQTLPAVLSSLRSIHAIHMACEAAHPPANGNSSGSGQRGSIIGAAINLSTPMASPSASSGGHTTTKNNILIGASTELIALRLALMQMLASLLYRLQSDACAAICYSPSLSSSSEPRSPSSRLAGSFSSFGITATPIPSTTGRSSFSVMAVVTASKHAISPCDLLTIVLTALRSPDDIELRDVALVIWRLLVEHLPRGIGSKHEYIRSFAIWSTTFLRTRPTIAAAALTLPVGGMAMAAAAAAAMGGAPHPAMAGADTAHSSLCLALDLMRAVALQCTVVHGIIHGTNAVAMAAAAATAIGDDAPLVNQIDVFVEWINALAALVEDHCRLVSGVPSTAASSTSSTPTDTPSAGAPASSNESTDDAFPMPPSPSAASFSAAKAATAAKSSPAPSPAAASGTKKGSSAVNWNVVASGPCPSPRLLELLLASWHALVAVVATGVCPTALTILPTTIPTTNGIGSHVMRPLLLLPRVTNGGTTTGPMATSLHFLQPLLQFAITHCEHSSPPLLLLQLLCGMLPSIRGASISAAAANLITPPAAKSSGNGNERKHKRGQSTVPSPSMMAIDHFLSLFCQWIPHSVHDETFQLLHVLLDLLTPTLSGTAVIAAATALLNRYTVRTHAATRARTALLDAILQSPKAVQCMTELVQWALTNDSIPSSAAGDGSSGSYTGPINDDVLSFKKRHADLVSHEQQKERIGLLCDCLAVASDVATDDSGTSMSTSARAALKALAVPYPKLQSLNRLCVPLLSAADARTSLSAVFIMDHAITALIDALDKSNKPTKAAATKPLNDTQVSFKTCATFLTTALDLSIRRSDADTTFATIRSFTTLLAALLFPATVRSSALSATPHTLLTDIKESSGAHGQRALAFGIIAEALPLLAHVVEIATHQQLRSLCLWCMVVWSTWCVRLMTHNYDATEYRPLQMELSQQCLQLVKASDRDCRLAGARMAASLAALSFSLTQPVPSTSLFPSFYLWTPAATRSGTGTVPLLIKDEVFVHIGHSLSDELCDALKALRRLDGQPAVQLVCRALQMANQPCPQYAIVACDQLEIHQLGLGAAPTSLTHHDDDHDTTTHDINAPVTPHDHDHDINGLFGTITRAYRLPSAHDSAVAASTTTDHHHHHRHHDTPWSVHGSSSSDTSLQPARGRRTWGRPTSGGGVAPTNNNGLNAIATGDISIEMLRRLTHVDDMNNNNKRPPSSPQFNNGYEETLEELGVVEDDSPGFGDDDDDLANLPSSSKVNGANSNGKNGSARRPPRPPPLSLNSMPKTMNDVLNPGEASPPIGGMGSPPLARGVSPTANDTSPPSVLSPPITSGQLPPRPSTGGSNRPQSAGRRRPGSAGSAAARGHSPPPSAPGAPTPNSQKPSWSSRPPTVPTSAWAAGAAVKRGNTGTTSNPGSGANTPSPQVSAITPSLPSASTAAPSSSSAPPASLQPPVGGVKDWGSSPPISPTDVPPMTFAITIDSPQPSTSSSPSFNSSSPSLSTQLSSSVPSLSSSLSTTTSSSSSSGTNGVSPTRASSIASTNVAASTSHDSSLSHTSNISNTTSTIVTSSSSSSLASLDLGGSTQSPPRLIPVTDRPGASLSASVVRPVATSPAHKPQKSPVSSSSSSVPSSISPIMMTAAVAPEPHPFDEVRIPTVVPNSLFDTPDDDEEEDSIDDDDDLSPDPEEMSALKNAFESLWDGHEAQVMPTPAPLPSLPRRPVAPTSPPPALPPPAKAAQNGARTSGSGMTAAAKQAASPPMSYAAALASAPTHAPPARARAGSSGSLGSNGSNGARSPPFTSISPPPSAANKSRSPPQLVASSSSPNMPTNNSASIAANRARTSVSPQLAAETEDIIAKLMASSSASLAAAPDRNKLAQGLGSLLSSITLPDTNGAGVSSSSSSSSSDIRRGVAAPKSAWGKPSLVRPGATPAIATLTAAELNDRDDDEPSPTSGVTTSYMMARVAAAAAAANSAAKTASPKSTPVASSSSTATPSGSLSAPNTARGSSRSPGRRGGRGGSGGSKGVANGTRPSSSQPMTRSGISGSHDYHRSSRYELPAEPSRYNSSLHHSHSPARHHGHGHSPNHAYAAARLDAELAGHDDDDDFKRFFPESVRMTADEAAAMLGGALGRSSSSLSSAPSSSRMVRPTNHHRSHASNHHSSLSSSSSNVPLHSLSSSSLNHSQPSRHYRSHHYAIDDDLHDNDNDGNGHGHDDEEESPPSVMSSNSQDDDDIGTGDELEGESMDDDWSKLVGFALTTAAATRHDGSIASRTIAEEAAFLRSLIPPDIAARMASSSSSSSSSSSAGGSGTRR